MIEKITSYKPNDFINDENDLWHKIVHKDDLSIIKKNENLLKEGKQIISRYRIIEK